MKEYNLVSDNVVSKGVLVLARDRNEVTTSELEHHAVLHYSLLRTIVFVGA